MVPWINERKRIVLILSNSKPKIRSLALFKRAVSCSSKPKLLTNSTLRKVSVVEPAKEAPLVTISFCIALIRRVK